MLTGAGLRPGAKVPEEPPDPTGGALALDPTGERGGGNVPMGVRTAARCESAGSPSLLQTAESDSQHVGVRRVRGGVVRSVLRGADGSPESATGALLPAAVHRLFRGSVVGARDRVAGCGFVEPSGFPGPGRDGGGAESLDAVTDPAPDRRGDACGGVHVGAGPVVGSGSGEGEDGRRGCDDAGSERGDAEHQAAGYGGIVRGVRAWVGGGIRHCDADAGGVGAF